MALGKQQQQELTKLVEIFKKSPDVIKLEVRIGSYRPYTREFGSGHAISVRVIECYDEGEFTDGEYPWSWHWIANCQYEHTALEKGQEIARWFVDQGCLKERVRLTK